MSNEEKILEMLSTMQREISSMKQDISGMKQDISGMKQDIQSLAEKVDDLAEAHEITRDGVNRLLDWSERVSNSAKFPLPDVI